MTPLAASLARTPELFPHVLEASADRALLSRLTEQDYADASFLDERILQAAAPTNPINFGALQSAVAESNLEPSAHFIFHIGHVGSTLLSRLLGLHPGVFALREPAILRTLAQIQLEAANAPPYWREDKFDARFLTLLKLLSRTFRPSQRAIIKVTSFASELAKLVLSLPYKPKAIFMFMPAEQYLAAILGAENSPREAQALAAMRLSRLNNRLDTQFVLQRMSIGEIVAMNWASEMTTLVQAQADNREHVLWLDFDKFLAQPQTLLRQSFAHFDITASDRQINDILTSPDMRHYSKAPEHEYDAALRNAVLNQGRQMFGTEISHGLRWLENAAPSHPLLALAMTPSPVS